MSGYGPRSAFHSDSTERLRALFLRCGVKYPHSHVGTCGTGWEMARVRPCAHELFPLVLFHGFVACTLAWRVVVNN